jgi:hypothetical protein
MAGDFKPKTLIDGFDECSGGMNRGVKPILLPKNVLANAINTTVRGTFPTCRPAFKKVTLTFSTPAVQVAFEAGIWQSGCPYDPDNEAESMVAALTGRLYQVTPEPSGHTASVAEVSAATTRQDAGARRCWLWQSENDINWNDGVSKPVFFNQFDSPVCTRSTYAAVASYTTHNEADFIIPPQGMGVVVNVHDHTNMVVGAIVTIANKGSFVIQSITDTLGVTADVDLMNQSAMPIGGNVVANTTLSWKIVSEELPPGRMGVYGMGRNSVCLSDGKNIVISDMVGGPSGTVAKQYRDAQRHITENFYLKGGGTFVIPGSVGAIKAMRHVSVLDQSLGQGPMQILTAKEIFSCMAPTDRSKWQTMTDPIMPQSLIGNGATGQDSTINAGGDLMFRSPGGIASLILGRRDFATWGNTTCSREVEAILGRDSPDLLEFASAVEFDNRLLMTCGPTPSPQGYYFNGLIALNFDPLSSLRGKAPAVYDGLWTGINILQLIAGEFNGRQRCFAFTYNAILAKIELYEVLKSGDADYDDGDYTEVRRIRWVIESPVLMGPAKNPGHDLLRLKSGEIRVDNLLGKVDFYTYYKPDQYPGWIPWFHWTECAKQPTSDPATKDYKPQFRPRMGLGEPDGSFCDETTDRPLREAHSYQVKVIIDGHCDFLGCDIMAEAIPQTGFAPQSCTPICE